MGHSRRFGDVRVTSAFPLIADVRQKGRHVSKVPTTDLSRPLRRFLINCAGFRLEQVELVEQDNEKQRSFGLRHGNLDIRTFARLY